DVRLRLKLLEVVLVGLGVDAPVEILQVIAGHVLAVLAELDGEAVERAGVQARQEALDDELGAQVEPGHLADDFGPQVFLRRAHDFHHSRIEDREWRIEKAAGAILYSRFSILAPRSSTASGTSKVP